MSITIITTCKGRLVHLKQTLPLMVAQKPDEVIVVDYDCPDGTGDWVEANFPQVKVVRAGQPDGGFNVSRARNLGAEAATSEWLYFVDADIRLAPTCLGTLRPHLKSGSYYVPLLSHGTTTDIWGSNLCRAEDLAAAGGYDEVIRGWGHEDEDFYLRLELLGLERHHYSPALLEAIPHDDAMRNIPETARNRWENDAANACYAMAKRALSKRRGGKGNLPLEERRTLIDHIRGIVGRWFTSGARQPLRIHLLVAETASQTLTSGIEVGSKTSITVLLRPQQQQAARPATNELASGPG